MWSFLKKRHYPSLKSLVTHFGYLHAMLVKYRERMGWCHQATSECASNGADTDDIYFTCYHMSLFQHWFISCFPEPMVLKVVLVEAWFYLGEITFLNSQASFPLASDWLVIHTKFHLNWIRMSQSFGIFGHFSVSTLNLAWSNWSQMYRFM